MSIYYFDDSLGEENQGLPLADVLRRRRMTRMIVVWVQDTVLASFRRSFAYGQVGTLAPRSPEMRPARDEAGCRPKSSSDFTVDLPEMVRLEDNVLCQIHEVSIPHSWYSMNNTNNGLYFRHQVLPPPLPSGAIYRKIPIPEGNYTASELTTELETQLNNYFDTGDRPNTYTVRYNATTNKIRIAVNYSEVIFLVLTDGEVAPLAVRF